MKVAPGVHTVRFVYRPASFYGGVALAAAALLAMVGARVVPFARRRPPIPRGFFS